MMYYLKQIISLPKNLVIKLITLYQHTLSLDHGWLKARHPHGYCRFYPTCSEYAKQALGKYGLFKGSYLAIWRVMRCNPWSKGGEDKVK